MTEEQFEQFEQWTTDKRRKPFSKVVPMNDFLGRHKDYLKYLLLLSLFTFVILCVATAAHGAWYDSNWQYRKQITIKGSEVTGGPHGSFSVLIQLASDADLAADAQDNGDDILFTSSDETTKIPHEIESFNGSTGALVAWVRVDLSANPANTIIYMYYGHASATNQEQVTQVWDSDYVGVWHLKETSGTHYDSTSYGNNGTPGGGVIQDTIGKINGANDFDGNDDHTEIGTTGFSTTNMTFSAWVKADALASSRYIFGHTTQPAYANRIQIYTSGTFPTVLALGLGDTHTKDTGSALSTGIWYHVVLVKDATNYWVYLNKTVDMSGTYTGLSALQTYADIGNDGNPLERTESWNGVIDEVRISKIARSANWIATSYSNQNNPANFVIIGSETLGGGSNNPPNVDAGSAQEVTLPNLANLDGTADDGGDGPTTPPNVEWTKQSGPGTVTFGDQYAQDTTATFSTDGIYVLRLTADDGADTAYDEVTITVYPAGGPPPVDDYSCSMKITIDNTKVEGTSPHYNFPVLISLTDDTLKNTGCGFVTSSAGDDIIFTNADKTAQLEHEIEKYDGSTGELVAWVRIPSLSTSVDTGIYVYYGNSNITSPQENPDGVWDSNYAGVWHLHDDFEDSTLNNNDGTDNGTTSETGKIANSRSFDGWSDYIEVADSASLSVTSELTMEAWVRLSNAGTNQKIVGKTNSTYTRGYLIGVQTGLYPEIWNSLGTNHTFTSGSISSYQWTHLATTWTTDGNMIGYINGSQVNSISAGSYNIGTNAGDLIIGAAPWNPDTFEVNGRIDEVRISSTARSADWITTSYNNQSDPSSFYSVDPPQCSETVPPISEFSCDIPITIDSSKVSGTANLVNFPVLISLTNTALKTTANCGSVQNSNGYDIIFSDSTQTIRFDHEVEKYDGAAGTLVAWVRIPSLSATSDTTIYVHFGHSSVCGPTENPTGVWDSNYKGVWHLEEAVYDETTTGTHYDSTANNNDGAQNRNNDAAGKIGVGQDFDGNDDFISVSNSASLQPTIAITLSGWVKLRSFGTADDVDPIIRKGDDNNNNYQLTVDEQKAQFVLDGGDGDTILGSTTLSANTWYYIAGTWQSGGQRRVYLNGVQNGSTGSFTGPIGTDTRTFYMGGRTGTDWMNGVLDEVRISDVARSADWITTSYNNQSDPASFYSVGASSCFLGGFSCNRKITIPGDNVSGTGNLTDFPLLIKIQNDCNLKTAANGGSIQDSNGWDIVFTDSGGFTQLDHEIEEYDGNDGDLTAWVKAPTLSGSSDTDIYMYYGKSGLTCDPSNSAGVWSNNYRGVWHLHDTSGATQDSTSYNTDGTLSGTITRGATGAIDNAFDFSTNGQVSWGDPFDGHLDAGTGSWTVSLWANVDVRRGVWEQYIRKGATSWGRGYNIEIDGSADRFYFNILDGSYSEWGISAPTIPFSLDTWTYVVGVVDRPNNRIRSYKDGGQIGTGTDISAIGSISTTSPLLIGNDWPDGRIEEVRISNTARSADWIKTEYDNQEDPESFYTMSEDTCGGAYGFNYQYCKKITVDHTQVNSDLTNFPLLVNITGDDDLKTVANGGRVEHNLGYDIVFKTTGCGNLDHEIEKYDGSAGTLVAWVRVPSLSSSTDTEVYMYYGDSNVICSPENPPGVWASNYAGVWHLDETVSDEASDGIHYDSTANDNDGSQTNNDDADGKVGTGQMFDGNGDYIYTSNSLNNPQNFTVSAWFKTSTASGKRVVGFESNQSGTYSGSWDRHIYVGTDGKVYFGAYSGSADVAVSTNTLNDDTWHYAVGVRDDGADYIRLYIDGSLNNSTYNANAENYSGWWRIGSYKSSGWPSGQDGFFPGGIDEVRVSNTVHSADWIMAEYKNQNDPGNFYTISSCFEQTNEVTQEWVEEVQ